MSFYGNVTYYLSNAFNKIIYRNENSKNAKVGSEDGKSSPGTPSYEYALSPRSRSDETILETGNKWIVFADPKRTVGNNQIQIFHATVRPETDDAKLTPLVRAPLDLPADDGEGTVKETAPLLSWGDIVGIPSIVYDNAGHITNGEMALFQMPVPPAENEMNELKRRLSQLEEYAMGEHGEDDGGGPVVEVDQGMSIIERLGTMENKVNKWELGAPDDVMAEPEGIGTTFHEFLADFGFRRRVETGTGTKYMRVLKNSQGRYDFDSGTFMYDIQDAQRSSQLSKEYSTSNRDKINEIINFLNGQMGAGFVELPRY